MKNSRINRIILSDTKISMSMLSSISSAGSCVCVVPFPPRINSYSCMVFSINFFIWVLVFMADVADVADVAEDDINLKLWKKGSFVGDSLTKKG